MARGYSRSPPSRLLEGDRNMRGVLLHSPERAGQVSFISAVRRCACAGGAKMQRVQKKRDNICLHIS